MNAQTSLPHKAIFFLVFPSIAINKVFLTRKTLRYPNFHHWLFLWLSLGALQAQNPKIDSLKTALENHRANDTIRVNLLNAMIYQVYDIDVNKAEILIQESGDLAEKLNFEKGKTDVIYYKAHIEIIKSNYSKAINYANQALKQYKLLKDKSGESRSLNCMGIAYEYQANYSKAIAYYKKSAIIDEAQNDLKGVAGSLNNIGNIYADQGKYKEAIHNYTQAKVIKQQLKDINGVARAYNNIGSIYGEQSNFPLALENFNRALATYDSIQNKERTIMLIINVATIYQIQNKLDEAMAYLYKALERSREQNNKRAIAICLNSIGNVYKSQFKNEKALVLFHDALEINRSINNKSEIAKSLNNVADLQMVLNQKNKALENYNNALALNTDIGSQLGMCKTYLGLAKYFHSQKQYTEALKNALNSQKIAIRLKLIRLQKEIAELLSIIYEDTGNYKKALENQQQFKALNDSLFNKENIEKITRMEYEYKYKQALDSASIRELKLTKTVLDTSQDLAESQQNYLWAIIGILVLSIVSGSMIFYQKFNTIKAKNEHIVTEQKLLRSQMTPHFIFNSLSVLQGMILNKEKKKSITYLSKFSKLLRIVLENSRDKVVPLIQELDAIDNYMILQNLDADLPYDYSLVVDENIDIDLFLIPPMLIQPFIENAIEHAFRADQEHREIMVRLTFKDKKLSCNITDNGIGIDTFSNKPNNKKKSLATTITNERLRLLAKDFKTPSGITIEDRKKDKEQGTRVTLIIPFKRNSVVS
ncbi:MAG: tetratricopeptide repeat protein [Flavobacteriaceae bacterium]